MRKTDATLFLLFEASLLNVGRLHVNSTIHNAIGIRLLTHLCLGLSHPNEQKFWHSLANCVKLLCSWSIKLETKIDFFLHCHNFFKIRTTLFDRIKLLDETLLRLNEESLLTVLTFDSKMYNKQVNVQILNASADHIVHSNGFAGSLI